MSYLEAAERGADCLHTSSSAAANGTGQPAMDGYLTTLAAAEGLAHGVPGEFDRSYFRHQLPGGMMGTMKRQLAEMKRLHLLPQVPEEVERVRADLGYPIMVTPFSQLLATQVLMNVVSGTR